MFDSVTLEVSLKPFGKDEKTGKAVLPDPVEITENAHSVAKKIFRQWDALLRGRKEISVMFWTADGSEILEYRGDLTDTFEWCRFIGGANNPPFDGSQDPAASLHKYRHDYLENAPAFTYGDLKAILRAVREEAENAYPEARITLGETFDIGPEFAVSDFKYRRHTEILNPDSYCDGKGFVDATSVLSGDSRAYAAFPNGIPEGLPFGSFLGAQSAVFLPAMGFDYLWLSNGLGFSADPWKKTGKIYDGTSFHPEKVDDTRKKVFGFWKDFRAACPDIPIRTRGTNNTVGIDYASDGVPLAELYENGETLGFLPPPNSPWAALDGNYGLEIVGQMTRLCELPLGKPVFPFRYYVHDPWWVNSPWYDRYEGYPGDIYLPMSVARVTSEGNVESANSLGILSVDNSFGELPDACANEPIPHLLKAEKDAPDEIAPFVLVYPMREYTSARDEATLREMYEGDRRLVDAVNVGLPLCTVTSTDAFLRADLTLYRGKVLFSPIPREKVLEKLEKFAKDGGKVVVYGTKEGLATLPGSVAFTRIDVEEPDSAERFLTVLEPFGYSLRFEVRPEGKVPTLAVSRHNGAFVFSAFSADTTADTLLSFPLGAPILIGGETKIEDGTARYRFSRADHRECRFFVRQKEGVVSARERPPVNAVYRRRLTLSGLSDATVCFFPETYCLDHPSDVLVSVQPSADRTPIPDHRFTVCRDEHGVYLRGEHIDGEITFLMPRRK